MNTACGPLLCTARTSSRVRQCSAMHLESLCVAKGRDGDLPATVVAHRASEANAAVSPSRARLEDEDNVAIATALTRDEQDLGAGQRTGG